PVIRSPGPDPLMDALFPGVPTAVDWGLGRMRKALAELGDPHRRYRALHVGGTNGKGSVASTWASVLQHQGERAGLYTSPHLCSFRERIMIDGAPVPAPRLIAAAETLRPLARELGMSFFEASTLLALAVFAEAGIDTACIEVGLGGRLDATNVIQPEVTAITNVALDHQEYLGDSLEEIAAEKAGIIKPNVPVVTAEGRPGALSVLEDRAARVGAPFHRIEPWRDIGELRLGRGGTRFSFRTAAGDFLDLRTPLPGAHQAANAALAVRALELLPRPPSTHAVGAGVAAVRWPGRGQVHRVGDLHYIFDVAHNRAAVGALARVLADLAPPRPLIVLAGILGDKNWSRMLPPLVDLADRVVFTIPASAPPERNWDPRAVASEVGDGIPIEVVDEVTAAVERAAGLAGNGTVVVTGSCHTVGDALQVLGVSPFGGG
ncbi:MAG: bifunctional folylpolyglutamate synthase/dihydrofolate synthase, partial [Gemmatimonadetes bacterium]|nr:bifunctional folylpolyglutamate synthase/dihydrofolate synthase [Gemmatimonadota bacterium]